MIGQLTGKTASGGRAFDPNIMALLSIELLLLAFFILLTSLGRFEERRVERVVRSVQESFAGRSLPEEPRGFGGAEAVLRQAAPIWRLRRAFEGSLPLERLEFADSGRVMAVVLASDRLFEADGGPSVGASLLLDRLAQALNDPDFAELPEISLLLGYAEGERIDLAAPRLARAGSLAEALVERGVAAERVSAGLLPRQPGKLRIELRLFSGAAPGFGRLPRPQR